MCLPTSRRKSSTLTSAVQSALSTSVARYGPGSKSSNALELHLDARDVVLERGAVEQVALLAAPARVADHPGRAAGEWEWTMTGELEATQPELAHQVADVKRVGRGVEADVDADRAAREAGRQERRDRSSRGRGRGR